MVKIIISVILGLLPSLVWLLFYLQEDKKRPEPKKLILLAFLSGALSTFFAIWIRLFYNNLFSAYGLSPYSFVFLLFFAGIEELTKFGVVYLIISKRKEFDEPIDPMIYMIAAALGFAAVENVATAIQTPNSLENIVLRFIGATLLHSLSSGLVGYYWGKALAAKRDLWSFIITGLLFAVLLHWAFNYLIIATGPFGLVIIFLVFMAFFVLNDFEKLKHLR